MLLQPEFRVGAEDCKIALEFTKNNKDALKESRKAGCYSCMKFFDPQSIIKWEEKTAICPICSNKTVMAGNDLGRQGYIYFLYEMHHRFVKHLPCPPLPNF